MTETRNDIFTCNLDDNKNSINPRIKAGRYLSNARVSEDTGQGGVRFFFFYVSAQGKTTKSTKPYMFHRPATSQPEWKHTTVLLRSRTVICDCFTARLIMRKSNQLGSLRVHRSYSMSAAVETSGRSSVVGNSLLLLATAWLRSLISSADS